MIVKGSILAVLGLGFCALFSESADAEGMLIIVNPSVEAAALSPREISAIYLLKTMAWADGSRIIPVNREATSPLREEFNGAILHQTNEALAAYWNEMHFKGRLPPVIQESDRAMLAFIRKVPGAIGYISESTEPMDVKIVGRVP